MQIGPYPLDNPVILAPMAGVTDRPFRSLCKRLGAGMVVSEMLSANPLLRGSVENQRRLDHGDELGLRVVQIAGSDPAAMADAARYNVAQGAQIIDINMGCPAKKVNKKMAGSALMQDPALVEQILTAVVSAVAVPVTLKTRTGWAPEHRNGLEIARIAERCGIASIVIHGRTRACLYKGQAEYDTVRAIKAALSIPVVVNGDITSPRQAKAVLDYTGCDGVMIGRAAQGRPWLPGQVAHFLATGAELPDPSLAEQQELMLEHVAELHRFYGEVLGPRIARKHVGWYLAGDEHHSLRALLNAEESGAAQLQILERYWAQRLRLAE
jgi:tRNA-dihydrouridine synthase B